MPSVGRLGLGRSRICWAVLKWTARAILPQQKHQMPATTWRLPESRKTPRRTSLNTPNPPPPVGCKWMPSQAGGRRDKAGTKVTCLVQAQACIEAEENLKSSWDMSCSVLSDSIVVSVCSPIVRCPRGMAAVVGEHQPDRGHPI